MNLIDLTISFSRTKVKTKKSKTKSIDKDKLKIKQLQKDNCELRSKISGLNSIRRLMIKSFKADSEKSVLIANDKIRKLKKRYGIKD